MVKTGISSSKTLETIQVEAESKRSQSAVRKVEVMLDRRRIVFHINDGDVVAYGQTAGGWGRVAEPKKLAQRLLKRGDLRFDRSLGYGD